MRVLVFISLLLFAFHSLGQSIGQSDTVSVLLKKANGFLVDKNYPQARYYYNLAKSFTSADTSAGSMDRLIESKITQDTSAIMATHVYGNPCNVKLIERIAKQYKLKVLYDAAHAFNIKIDGKSILNFGDASILSFHATKLFHTAEGGAVICKSKKILNKINSYV